MHQNELSSELSSFDAFSPSLELSTTVWLINESQLSSGGRNSRRISEATRVTVTVIDRFDFTHEYSLRSTESINSTLR